MNLQTYKDRFIKTHKDMMNEFNVIKESDLKEKAITLKPGEKLTFGEYSGFHSSVKCDYAKEKIREYRNKQTALIEELKKEISSNMSNTPTEETTRAIQSMQLVKNPTKDYINSMLERYGDNYTAYQVIYDYARQNDVVPEIPQNIIEVQTADGLVKTLNNEVSRRYDVSSMMNSTPGSEAFLEFALNTF